MNINHASRLSFNREFYAIDVKQDGTLDLKVRTLNIFQRALRFLFGAYSNTIWNQSKSTAHMNKYPGEWKKIQDSIVSDVVFARVFKIAKSVIDSGDSDSDLEIEEPINPISSDFRIIPDERPVPPTMSVWKEFARGELREKLNEIDLDSRIIPDERPVPPTMSVWKEFARGELREKLNEIDLDSRIIPDERPVPPTMSVWKKFARGELREKLNEIDLEFKESTERGDCFFDSIAYLLTKLRGDKQYTAQDIRTDISNYLKRMDVLHEKYEGLLNLNRVDANTYEKYCENIGKCACEGYDPIWGDNLAIQIISDLYNLNVTVYRVILLPVDREEIEDGGAYEDYKSIVHGDAFLVCSKLDKNDFIPSPNRPNPKAPKDTIVVGNLSHAAWGHFVPVVKTK